jgi:glycosyltransferase involved in cell wall biosynthesis
VVNCKALELHLTEDEGVKPSLIRLCYNGINAEVFRRRSADPPPELRDASLVVGAACALRPEKDLPTLLRAFGIAFRLHPQMKLLIVGSGAMRDRLESLSRELNIREACMFVPSTADVPHWLSLMDVFVLPSISEALSNSLMEAMASGCAPIASNVGGNPELVANGERGLLFNPRNIDELARHIVRFAEDSQFRFHCAEASRSFIVEHFSLSASVQRMTAIYSEMLARKQPCAHAAS